MSKKHTKFAVNGNQYSPTKPYSSTKFLDPGMYTLGLTPEGRIIFEQFQSTYDDLVKMPNTISEQVTSEIRKFWEPETKAKYERYGIVYKRGILLYGKQGTGKTCTVLTALEELVAEGGIAIFNPNPKLLFNALEAAREIQPDLKVLVILEEFDDVCRDSNYKSLLDGEIQVDNMVVVATTNYIDQIPDTFKNRPGRFASVLEVKEPNAEARRAYLKAKLLPSDQKNLTEWVEKSAGLVIDQIKDLITSVFVYDLTLDEAISKVRAMDPSLLAEEREEDEDSTYGINRDRLVSEFKRIYTGTWKVPGKAS